ncbi:MAG: HAMP domain-containing protein, partial [Polyangiaceae bacterium]|nr:HAMP domain-containing protein [Polyangiaceae bacterium]
MSASSPSQRAPIAPGRDKRRVRNYLLMSRFQLKYAGLLVFVAVLLSCVLGSMLWNTSNAVISQSQQTLEQGLETVRRGQK